MTTKPDSLRERLLKMADYLSGSKGVKAQWITDTANLLREAAETLAASDANLRAMQEERETFGVALNEAGSTLTTTWNVARWEPEKFKPEWFMAKYDAWLLRLTHHDIPPSEFQMLKSLAEKAEAERDRLQAENAALRELAKHAYEEGT